MPLLNPKLGIDFSNYIVDRTLDFTGREWVFEVIQSWLADPKGDRFFLLTGEPGSGKTAIAARLTQFAQGVETYPGLAEGFLQAVHFCSARDSIWIDPKEFARSLALQLAASIPEFWLALKDVGEKTTNINVDLTVGTAQNSNIQGVVIQNLTLSGITTGQEAFTQLVVNPLRQIQQEGFSQPVTILVDSLDEALTHDGESTIVSLLSNLSASVKLQLILTSRNEGRVKDQLDEYEELFLSASEHLEKNQQDVRAYINAKFSQEQTLQSSLQAEALDQAVLTTSLIEKSEGNFLYVRFLLESVALGQQSFANLDGLPQGLDELYYSSLGRVVELGKKGWSEVYAPVMGVLLAAQESLTESQIRAFTKLKESVVWDCLNDLQQFLDESESEDEETLYKLYHQSVSDFLGKKELRIRKEKVKKPEKVKNRYYLPGQEQHELIVNAYVSDGQALHTRIRSDLYFWNHFPYHLDRAGKTTELRQLLLNFSWLAAKLDATNIHALISDYSFLPDDTDLLLLQSALQLAENTLAKDKSHLSGQLLGHILSPERSEIQALLEEAKLWKATPWLRPLIPSLIPAGGPLLRIFSGHQEEVNSLAVTPDGRWVVSGSSDETVKVWDLNTGIEILTFEGHNFNKYNSIRAVVAAPDSKQVASVASGDFIRIWNLKDGKETHAFKDTGRDYDCLAITTNGERVISGSSDGTIQIWDVKSGNLVQSLKGHSESIKAVAVTPDSKYVVSASSEGTLEVWNLNDGQQMFTFKGHDESVNAVALISINSSHISTGSTERTLLISASNDKMIKVWDLSDGTLINTLKGHEASVNAVTITPDRKFIVSGSYDRTLKVWDLSNGQLLHTFRSYVDNVRALDISPSGKHIISSSGKYLKVWNLYSRVELPDPIGHGSAVNTMAVTPNGRQAISASENGILKVWDLDTRTEVFNIKGHQHRLNALAVTPDSKKFISSTSTNIKLWDLTTGALIDSFNIFEEDNVQALVVTPDGKQIVAASNSMAGASAAVWDVNSRPHTLPPTDFSVGDVCAVAVTSDMKHVILGSRSHLFKVRNLNGGEEVSAFQAEKWNLSTRDYNRRLNAMAISPDGLIVSGTSSKDGTIKVWNLRERRKIHTLVGHTEAISAVAVTARGKRVISVSEDGTVKVWDLTRGKVIASYDSDTSLYSCAVTSDGRTIVAGDGLGRVHFLRLEGV